MPTSSFFRCSLVMLCALLCSACVGQRSLGNKSEQDALTAWQSFAARANAAEVNTGPFRISATMRYTTTKETTRVAAFLWGNGNADAPYPIRLDLLASVGNVVAKIREDHEIFMAFNPGNETAYFHPQGRSTLEAFGVPIPLSLEDLTLLLTGRSGMLFLPPSTTVSSPMPKEFAHTEKGTAFTISTARLSGILEVSPLGVPLVWRENKDTGWVITFDPSEKNPLQPRRLLITHTGSSDTVYDAVIVIKEITHLPQPYTKAQLDLQLPKHTLLHPLSDLARP